MRMRSAPKLLVLLGPLAAVVIAAVAGPAAAAPARQAVTGPADRVVPVRTWRQVPSPAVPDGSGITAIAPVTVTDAWAAGWTPSGGLIEHWNGVCWRLVRAPAANLTSIAAASPSDVWVTSQSLTASKWRLFHWNGTRWSNGAAGLPARVGPGYGDVRPDVSDAPGVGAWAAVNVPARQADGAAVFHWDGTSWRQVGRDIIVPGRFKPPWYAAGAPAVLTPRNVWLGGISQAADKADGDSAHWDGSAWKVSSAVRGTPCCAVSMSTSGGRLWAYGSSPSGIGILPLVAWRAGSRWRDLGQPSPNDIMEADTLAADGLGNVWVVGQVDVGPPPGILVLHWNGAHWMLKSFPGRQAVMYDVEAVPGTPVVWAAGTHTVTGGRTQPLFDITIR
jgi:hypothetical protein